MIKTQFDAATIDRVFKAMIAENNMRVPYLLGVLPRVRVLSANTQRKNGRLGVEIPNMMGSRIDVLPSVAEGNRPFKIDSVEFEKDWVPFDHFFLETNLGTHEFVEAQKQLQAIESGEISDQTAKDVMVKLHGNNFARAVVARNNKQTLFWYSLIANGSFEVVRDTHNDPYFYKVNGYNTFTVPGADFDTNAIEVLTRLRSKIISQGGSCKSILLGDTVATRFMNSAIFKSNIYSQLKISGFNYTPINAINPDNKEVQALGIYDLMDLGGVKVRRVSTYLKVNGVEVPAFDPNAIIAIDENNVGALYTTPFVRNTGNANFIFDSSDMTHYLAKEDTESVTHYSRGFHLPAITKPQNILKLILST
jgi:hypothetical protein